jgi:Holliday junction resolvase RusA-like endonuclease
MRHRQILPFEFVVPGPPVSAQARDRRRLDAWRRLVRRAAQAKWPKRQKPIKTGVRLTVCYFHDRVTIRLDNDNLVKPIQDALSGVVYADDRLITDTRLRKTCLDGAFRVRGLSTVLAIGFQSGREFLHIIVDPAPDHEDLLS